MSTALLIDRYELTMLEAALESGVAEQPAVFEVFARRLPAGRRFGVVAGQGRLAALLPEVRWSAEDVAALDFLRPPTRGWLTNRVLDLRVSAYAEGDTYLPGSPVLTVEGSFGEGLLLETLVLSVLNADTAVASAAARMVLAAGGRPLLEMGGRRTHEQAAVSAARAAYVGGFAFTSNLEAGRRHRIPTAGTSAHAFTLAHASELDAFRAQVASLGAGTTLLVDTYDIAQGIRNAVEAAGPSLGGVRLDSGDPRVEVPAARALLDRLGAVDTRIVVTGDLDEHQIAQLAAFPVDSMGVGTALVTGSGAPTAGFVYKLVAVGRDGVLRPVAKRSPGKKTVGGRKWAWRDADGAEVLTLTPEPPGPSGWRPLQQVLPADDGVESARTTCAAALAALPPDARLLTPGAPPKTATVVALASEPLLPGNSSESDAAVGWTATTALIVVDVQNDFADPAGSLSVTGGPAVVQAVNGHVAAARAAGATVVYTQDWHPAHTPHFTTGGGPWPVHCVGGTWGAELHRDLVVDGDRVRKGEGGEDGYSGFTMADAGGTTRGTGLTELLRARGVTSLVVVGLATDYCIRATVLDGLLAGWPVTVPSGAVAAVDVEPGDGARALAELTAAGARVT